jgi:hypothetical protein
MLLVDPATGDVLEGASSNVFAVVRPRLQGVGVNFRGRASGFMVLAL